MKLIDVDAIYLRKSRADIDIEKATNEETLKKHKDFLIEFANANGWNVGEIYEEVVSGESIADRPEMQRLLKDVLEKKYRGVLVMEVERLARGATKDQGEMAEAFKYSETLIVTPSKVYDPNNDEDEEYFEFGLFMSRREYKTIKRRLETGRMRVVREGNYISPVAPYGYKIVRENRGNRYLVPHEEQAQYVKMMFEWTVNEGMGCGEISRRLTAMGVPTSKGKLEWHRATIRDILHNDIYTGKMRWHRRKIKTEYVDGKLKKVNHRMTSDNYTFSEGKHDAIISQELFDEAQKCFNGKSPTNQRKLRNILAGLLKCSKCGKTMLYHPFITRPTTQPRMVHAESQVCRMKSANAEEVMRAVIDTLIGEISDFEIKVENSTNGNELERFNATKETMIKELSNLNRKKNDLFNKFEDGYYTSEEFMERKLMYVDRIDKLKTEIENLHPPKIEEYQSKIKTFNQIMDSIKDDDEPVFRKNALLKSIIDKIEYTNTNGIELDIHFL